jgi:hypothetical protein
LQSFVFVHMLYTKAVQEHSHVMNEMTPGQSRWHLSCSTGMNML